MKMSSVWSLFIKISLNIFLLIVQEQYHEAGNWKMSWQSKSLILHVISFHLDYFFNISVFDCSLPRHWTSGTINNIGTLWTPQFPGLCLCNSTNAFKSLCLQKEMNKCKWSSPLSIWQRHLWLRQNLHREGNDSDVGVRVKKHRLNDLNGLSQPKWFYDSVNLEINLCSYLPKNFSDRSFALSHSSVFILSKWNNNLPTGKDHAWFLSETALVEMQHRNIEDYFIMFSWKRESKDYWNVAFYGY